MFTKLEVKMVSQDRWAGKSRDRMAKRDVARLMSWDGFDIAKVRGGRGVRKYGTIHFTTGCGYAGFAADLLGGNGDGTAERRAGEAGFIFTAKREQHPAATAYIRVQVPERHA